jgi:hypothetical protein
LHGGKWIGGSEQRLGPRWCNSKVDWALCDRPGPPASLSAIAPPTRRSAPLFRQRQHHPAAKQGYLPGTG